MNNKIIFGNRKLVGQNKARGHVQRILDSGRLAHAYLISGPSGAGKTAFALGMAEWINGIDNISNLGDKKFSKKSSWANHPDIHIFIPKPTKVSFAEVRERLDLLAKDPYEIINFSERPSISSNSDSKNRQAFYPVKYFKEEIRPVTMLKPNEGKRLVVILTQVDTMRKEAANAFLKLLEEPSDRLMFILTTDHYDRLLQTITSRCQQISLSPLKTSEIEQGLHEIDGYSLQDAQYLARISEGNYALTRFYDIETLKEKREQVLEFLRMSYKQDAINLTKLIQNWQSENNIEGLISITNMIETYLRDLMVYKATGNKNLVTNSDQLTSIQKFTDSLGEALLEDMISEVNQTRIFIKQNVSPKLIFTILSLRFTNLIRGSKPSLTENWEHIPALSQV